MRFTQIYKFTRSTAQPPYWKFRIKLVFLEKQAEAMRMLQLVTAAGIMHPYLPLNVVFLIMKR